MPPVRSGKGRLQRGIIPQVCPCSVNCASSAVHETNITNLFQSPRKIIPGALEIYSGGSGVMLRRLWSNATEPPENCYGAVCENCNCPEAPYPTVNNSVDNHADNPVNNLWIINGKATATPKPWKNLKLYILRDEVFQAFTLQKNINLLTLQRIKKLWKTPFCG